MVMSTAESVILLLYSVKDWVECLRIGKHHVIDLLGTAQGDVGHMLRLESIARGCRAGNTLTLRYEIAGLTPRLWAALVSS
jgi:hypothetical protein